MTHARRADANQPQIVQALRDVGAQVAHTHMIGQGFPDLLCYYHPTRRLVLLEVKDPSQPPSKRALTGPEQAWHDRWQDAPVFIVETVADAYRAIGVETL